MKILRIILLVTIIGLLNTGVASAKSPDPTKKVSPYTQMMYDEVRDLVVFPDFARELGIGGFVLVSFNYDENGQLYVIEANSNDDALKDYVIAKLTTLELCTHARKAGKVYNMRFDFRLI